MTDTTTNSTSISTASTSAKMPTQLLGADGPPVSRIALGCMGLTGTWNPAEMNETHVHRAVAAFEAAMDAGITFYDHADIYGGGTCEDVFKDCLRAVPGSRDKIVIATKCGILHGHYNLSYAYIQEAIDRSLKRLGVEYIDLYQLHRPDPFTHASETARALNELVRQGKVRTVGVSNYYPEQVRALQRYLDMPIRSNQFQVSLRHLPPIYDDGTLDQCEALQITPLAYSPLGGGVLSGKHEPGEDKVLTGLLAELKTQSEAYNATPAQVAIAWLLAHPAQIVPLVGSANPAHIYEFAGAINVNLSREDWYKLWVAGRGQRVP